MHRVAQFLILRFTMLIALRAGARAAGVFLVIPLGYLALLPALLALAPFPRARVDFTSWYFRRWAAAILAVLGITVRVSGVAPEPPFFMVSNHLGYVDIIVLASRLRCVFLAKREVRSWPLVGLICATLGTIFIDRGQRRDIPRVLAELEAAMARGLGVVIFPEGTSTRGATVEPFKSPLLALATRLGLPVHHATLRYETPASDPPAYLAVNWYGDTHFARHALGLLQVSRVEASLHLDPEPVAETDRKLLAERLRAAILARFEPMVGDGEGSAEPAR
ncbi:MAG TPA: lysophospholipid acyltransferase family protein [Thermoanaerobaculia bacterium]|nr:lysophospholipid acyltransferase family protein [Thermoanaerobaculia bacterium]